jgi:medium-chain acyl-[acyl-carrier-protein] hydrolase
VDGLTGGPGGWAVRWYPVPTAPLRLFCVPHAGGGATVYRDWARRLAPAVEVIAVRLPGREARFGEPLFTRIDDLMPEMINALAPWLDRPHAWFGHSMGGVLAFEGCRRLRELGLPTPVRLLVSGTPAPQLELRVRLAHDAPADELLAQLHELGGTPREVLDYPAALALLLPMVRSDLAMVEYYTYRPGSPLTCPISVFGGNDDRFTTPEELHAWRVHSTDECVVRTFPGDHFYLHQDPEQILSAITEDLSDYGLTRTNFQANAERV